MTNEEALKIAKSTNPLLHQNVGRDCGEYVERIIEALEKQIPKKVINKNKIILCSCENCEWENTDKCLNHEQSEFCIDWKQKHPMYTGEFWCQCRQSRLMYKQKYCPNCGQSIDWSKS